MFSSITRTDLVATLGPQGVVGLLCESDPSDPNVELDSWNNVVLEDNGKYHAVFAQPSIENQVCVE